MFGRDPITPVAKLLEPKPRYYGEKGSALKMDTLRRLYTIVLENIRKARERKPKIDEVKKPHSFKVSDMVLLRDCEAFSVVNTDCLQGNYTGYDLSWVTSMRTIMNTNKSPSFQMFEQFINNNNNTQLQV